MSIAEKSLLKLLEKLVSFKTYGTQRAELLRAKNFIRDYFSKLPGVVVEDLKLVETPVLFVHFKGDNNPEILMSAHFDVIAAGSQLFKMRKSGRKIFGRGVLDMKGGAAVIMEVMKHFAVVGSISKKPSLGLLLTADEETNGAGVKTFVARTKVRPRIVLLPDGGYGFKPVAESKGVLWVKATAFGKFAHGSRPWEGDNAAEKLHKYFDRVSKHVLWMNHGRRWGPTLNLSKIEVGSTINQVPAEGSIYFDIRYPASMAMQKPLDVLKKALLFGMKLEIITTSLPVETDKRDLYIKKFSTVFKKVMGKKVVWQKETGATDGRYFSYRGIPVIVMSGNGGNIHTDTEWADFRDLISLKNLHIHYIETVSFLGKEV